MTPAIVIDGNAADTLLGKPVQSAAGDDMGRIVDVIVDRGGMMRAAIIDFGGFLGVGSRQIAVDWRVLHFSQNGGMDKIIAELSQDQLRVAPVYKPGEPVVVVGRADVVPATPAPAPGTPPAAVQAPATPAPAVSTPAVPAPAAPAPAAPAAAPAPAPAAPAAPAAVVPAPAAPAPAPAAPAPAAPAPAVPAPAVPAPASPPPSSTAPTTPPSGTGAPAQKP